MRSIQIFRCLASLKYNRSSLGGRVYKTERDNDRGRDRPKDNIAKVDMIVMDFFFKGKGYIIFTILTYS